MPADLQEHQEPASTGSHRIEVNSALEIALSPLVFDEPSYCWRAQMTSR